MGREEGSGWGTRVYLWWIHVDIWQNQYNIVKLKNKRKKKKGKKPDVNYHQSVALEGKIVPSVLNRKMSAHVDMKPDSAQAW